MTATFTGLELRIENVTLEIQIERDSIPDNVWESSESAQQRFIMQKLADYLYDGPLGTAIQASSDYMTITSHVNAEIAEEQPAKDNNGLEIIEI